jgi:hypothetical protein
MTATVTPIPERVEIARTIKLSPGSHQAPPPDEPPCEACEMELEAWICGLPWGDSPGIYCTTIEAFIRQFQDLTDQAGRDKIQAWVDANRLRLLLTAGDGHREARGFLARDFAVRVALPVWLVAADATEAAEQLRQFPVITDRAGALSARDLIRKLRGDLPDWYNYYSTRYDYVYNTVTKAIKEKFPDGLPKDLNVVAEFVAAAAAATATATAAAATAYTDALGVVYTETYAAATAATADAATAYAADAAATAATADAAAAFRRSLRSLVYAAVREKWSGRRDAAWAKSGLSCNDSAIELLESMVALGEAA